MSPFVYVWAYEVLSEKVDDFLRLYGPGGAWISLFRLAPGYIDTQLLVDRSRDDRFVTVDRWESRQAFADFRRNFAEEFDRLDRMGEEMTSNEVLVGEFDSAQ